MVIGVPGTPLSKTGRTPSRFPGSRRTIPSSTPGGPKLREEKILVTIRVRPLSPKEQAAYDLIAWDFPDQQTIVSKNLIHERHTGPYSFGRLIKCELLVVVSSDF